MQFEFCPPLLVLQAMHHLKCEVAIVIPLREVLIKIRLGGSMVCNQLLYGSCGCWSHISRFRRRKVPQLLTLFQRERVYRIRSKVMEVNFLPPRLEDRHDTAGQSRTTSTSRLSAIRPILSPNVIIHIHISRWLHAHVLTWHQTFHRHRHNYYVWPIYFALLQTKFRVRIIIFQ